MIWVIKSYKFSIFHIYGGLISLLQHYLDVDKIATEISHAVKSLELTSKFALKCCCTNYYYY